MKHNIFHLALLCLLMSSATIAQKLKYRPLNSATGVLDTIQDFPTNAIADDFGPRDLSDFWHGGIDFNCVKNDGDADKWNPIISPQGGFIADFDRLTLSTDFYKYGLVNVADDEGNDSHSLLFGHVFDWSNQFYDEFNHKIILTRCNGTDNDKWGLHLNFTDTQGNILRHTYGQISGAILDINGTDAGGTYTTSNIVNTTDIFIPLGNSGGRAATKTKKASRFKAHLHFNTLPYNTEISDDPINGDPTEFLNIDRPFYDISVRTRTNASGLELVYPGNDSTKIRVRTQMRGDSLNVNRYEHLMDMDKVELQLKKSSEKMFGRIIGDQIEAIISEGGRLGESVINHTNPVNKVNWASTGIHSNAYNADTTGVNARNPWDDYYFVDFKTRIHKDDVFDNKTKFADIPQNSRYEDYRYNFRVKTITTNNGITYGGDTMIYIDNFKPYITYFNIKHNNTPLHQLDRLGDEGNLSVTDDGFVKNKVTSYSLVNNIIGINTLDIEIRTSEPMRNMTFGFKKNYENNFSTFEPMTRDAIDTLKWKAYITIFAKPNDCFNVQFKGQDLTSNQILNIYKSSSQNNPSTPVKIPTRKGSGNQDWNNLPQDTLFTDQIDFCVKDCDKRVLLDYSFGVRNNSNACLALGSIIDQVVYNSCKDANIRLEGPGFNPSNYTITWSDATGNILQDYNDQNEINVISAGTYCYKVEAIDDCCVTEGCMEVFQSEMQNKLEISETLTYSTCGESATIFISDVGELGNSYNNIKYLWNTGSTLKSINVPAGTYTVTVTVNNPTMYEYGCTNTKEFTVEERALIISATTEPICPDETGSISPIITGGVEPLTFLWSNDETTLDITDLHVGTYYLYVEDANGCWEIAEFEIKIRDKIVAVSNFKNLQDCTVPDGSITISSLLDEIIIYRWYDSSGNQISTNKDLSGLSPGTYRLVATSENGCTTEISQSICCCNPGLNTGDPGACYIGYNKDLTVTGTVTHTSNGINNGSVILFVQGGKGQYVFNWTGPDGYSSSEKDITNLAQGEYTVTVTDGCMMITKTFIINDGLICQQANIIITGKTTCIFPNIAPGKIDITVTGGTPPYTYQWLTDGSTNEDYTSFYNGSTVTITDKNGCTAKKDFQLEKATPLNVDFEISNPDGCDEFVNDVLLKVTVNSGIPPYKIRVQGVDYEFASNYKEFIIHTDNQYWAWKVMGCTISDQCKQEAIYNKTINCMEICPDPCIKIGKSGDPTCVDLYDDTPLDFGGDKIKIRCDCDDNVVRTVFNQYNSTETIFKGNQLIDGYDEYKLYFLGTYPFTIINQKTGCLKTKTLYLNKKCPSFWDLSDIFVGPGSTSGGDDDFKCPDSFTINPNPVVAGGKQEISIFLPSNVSSFIVQYINEAEQVKEEKDIGKLKKGNHNIETNVPSTPGTYTIRILISDCFPFELKTIVVDRPSLIKDDCDTIFTNLVHSKFLNKYIAAWYNGNSVKSSTFSKLGAQPDFTAYSELPYNSIIIKEVRFDNEKNQYLFIQNLNQTEIIKIDSSNKIIWSTTIPLTKMININDGQSGGFNLISQKLSIGKYFNYNIDKDGNINEIIEMPLLKSNYLFVNQSGETTIAFESHINQIIFATKTSSIEKQITDGITVKDIKILSNGNFIIAGEYNSNLNLGDKSYNSDGYQNVIFLTYDISGNLLSSKSEQNSRDETVFGFAVKGSEEVAYHGKYREIFYDINPDQTKIESCVFVHIIPLSDTSCTLLPPVLSLDVQTCTLDIEQQQMDVNYTLQQKTDSIWSEISGATLPYSPEMNGLYRISASTPNCPSAVSELIDVNCIGICHKEALDIIYNDQQEKFQHFYKVGLQTNTVNDEWISPSTFESVQSLLALQCENITISYIRVDGDQNIYIIGSDPGNIHRARIIKYHSQTMQVLWSHWIENFRIESVIPYAVGNIITLAGYHPVEKTWYLNGYLLKDGVLSFSSVQNIDKSPDKINVEYDAIYWLGENKYIYKEHNNPSVTYKSPENTWTAPLPPLIVVREFSINHWNQVTVGGEFFGSFTINDVLYESGLFRSLVFITYNNTGQVIHVNVIKLDRHYILKTFANNGYYRYAYTGYVSETAFPDSLLQNTASLQTFPGVCVVTGGFVNENIQSRHVSESFKAIRFYPNPFSKVINLDITSDKEEQVTIETFNTVGTLMFAIKLDIQKGQNVRYIDAFERMPVGVYIVKIKSNDLEQMTRVIRIE